jgi:hypothetical protein
MPKEAGFPLYRIPLDMHVGLLKPGVLSVRAAGFPVFEKPVTIETALRKGPFVEILARMLGESGDSLFMPGNLSFANETDLADDEVFVPPSQLKKAKNELYSFLDGAFAASLRSPAATPDAAPLQGAAPGLDAETLLASGDIALLAHREALSPRNAPGDRADIPFVSADPSHIDPQGLFLHAGYRWFPLPPVLRDDIGLNNLSHLAIASALRAHQNIAFFADFYLYVANHRALSLLSERVPGLLFAYAWIEGARGEETKIRAAAAAQHGGTRSVPVVALASDFKPPLFYSLGCFARHIPGEGKCLDDCPKDFEKELRQGRNRFRVVVRDCVTYLFAQTPNPPGRSMNRA